MCYENTSHAGETYSIIIVKLIVFENFLSFERVVSNCTILWLASQQNSTM